jgi:hypothetical protein
MSKLKYEIEIENAKAAKSLNELESSVEALKSELKGLEIGSKEFDNLAREIQKAESKVKDIERTYESADLEGRFGRLGDVLGGVARGAGAVQGAIFLMGEESEEAEEVMARLMAAMSIADSIEGFGKMASAIQKMGNVTKIATSIQAAFNVVLNLNPIGLIVIAVAALVAGIILMSAKVQEAIQWFKELDGWAKILVMIFGGPLIAVIGGVTWALEQLGVIEGKEDIAARKREEARVARHKAKIDQLKDEIKAIDEVIATNRKAGKEIEERYQHEINLIAAAGGDTSEAESMKLEATRSRLATEIELLEERYQKEVEMLDNLVAIHNKGALASVYAGAAQTAKKERKQQLTDLKKDLDDTEKAIEVHEAKVLKMRMDNAKKWADEQKAAREKEIADRLAHNERLFKAENQHQEMYRKQREEQDKLFRDSFLERTKVQTKGFIEINAAAFAYEGDLTKLHKRSLRERIGLTTEQIETSLALTKEGLTSLNSLVQAFAGENEKSQKAAFNFNKAIGIANASIDTFVAVNKALATLPPPVSFIQAGITLAAGLANVATIAKMKFNSPAPSGGSVGSAGGGGFRNEPPRLQSVQGTIIDANGDQIQDNRVVVVESDVRRTTSRVNVIESQAKIG